LAYNESYVFVQALVNRHGKFVTVPLNEVFSEEDEKVQHLIKARENFYKVFISNRNELNQESIRSLVMDKAKQAELNDWVEYLELLPEISKFNKQVVSSDVSVDDLISVWDDLFDSLSSLEEEVAHLTKPAGRLGFSSLVYGQMKQSVTDAIANTYRNTDTASLISWGESIEQAFQLIPVRMNEAKHMALLAGKELSDSDLIKVRATAVNKLISDTLPISIQLASAELKENTTSVALAKLLTDQLHYPKDALAQFHKKKTWGELLASAAEVDVWAGVLTLDHWRGSIKINRGYGSTISNNVELNVFYKNSLLKPIAELSQSNSGVLKGVVTKSESGVHIKDKLGNWNWQGMFDDEGTFVVSGGYPANYRVYTINTKLRSPIAIKKLQEARIAEAKRLESERLAKIEALHQQLKKEEWYGVPFNKHGYQWAANPVLISLDFNQNQYTIRDVGAESEQQVITSFNYDIDEHGKGQLSDVKGVKTKVWDSGDRWDLSFDSESNKLILNIDNVGKAIFSSEINWKMQLMPKSVYMQRLNNLTVLAHSTWSAGKINSKGASSGRWVSKLQLYDAVVIDDVVKLKGQYSFDVTKTAVTFIAVPAFEKGMVLAPLNLTEKNIELGWQQLKYGAAFSEDTNEPKLVLRDWKNKWGFVQTSSSKMFAESSSKSVDVKQLASTAPAVVIESVIKKEKIASKERVITQRVIKQKQVETAHHKPVKSRNNSSVSNSDSKILNQAINSLEALL